MKSSSVKEKEACCWMCAAMIQRESLCVQLLFCVLSLEEPSADKVFTSTAPEINHQAECPFHLWPDV